MTLKTYIIKMMDELVKTFPTIKVKYIADKFGDSHIIEVTPETVYNDNKKYSEYESNLIFDFIYKFPNEEIVFVTEGSIFNFENSIQELVGSNYCEEKIFSDIISIEDISENFTVNILEGAKIGKILKKKFYRELDDYLYTPEQSEDMPFFSGLNNTLSINNGCTLVAAA